MARCPNCGAELAPSVLSCGNCRMPVHPGAGPSPQSDDTVIRPGDGSDPSSPDAYWGRAAQDQPARPYPSAPPPGPSQPPRQDTSYRGLSAGSPPSGGHRPTLPPPAPHDDPRADRQRRNTVTMIVLAAVVLLIALVSGVVVLTSMDGAETAGDEGQPSVPANSPATTQPAPSPSDTAPTTPSPSATTPTPSPTPEKGPTTTAADAKTCSPGLQVPATGTSCEFAGEVKKQVADADPEKTEFSVHASSPVTKKDYTMKCVRNSVLTTCTGGNNAVVWIHNGG